MRNDATIWYGTLTDEQKHRVKAWLEYNKPPEKWKGDAIEYAFTEMMFAPNWLSWRWKKRA